ncbi:hypothetical protein ABPG72_019822 [Tetrahymena utriculariae]
MMQPNNNNSQQEIDQRNNADLEESNLYFDSVPKDQLRIFSESKTEKNKAPYLLQPSCRQKQNSMQSCMRSSLEQQLKRKMVPSPSSKVQATLQKQKELNGIKLEQKQQKQKYGKAGELVPSLKEEIITVIQGTKNRFKQLDYVQKRDNKQEMKRLLQARTRRSTAPRWVHDLVFQALEMATYGRHSINMVGQSEVQIQSININYPLAIFVLCGKPIVIAQQLPYQIILILNQRAYKKMVNHRILQKVRGFYLMKIYKIH